MKNVPVRPTGLSLIRWALECAVSGTLLVLVVTLPFSVKGELNTWTNASSGNWEEPYWSLGVLPTNGQYVALDNEGWKAVTIGPATAQSYSQRLTVYSLTISSPTNSRNVLLMNYAGLETPLRTRLLTVSSNSEMTLLRSSLNLNGGTGEGLSIGGEFNQDDSSLVTGQQADVGYIGPGVYNLKSGTLDLKQMWLGGSFNGQFNQYGGTSRVGILHLDSGGAYNFYGGEEFPTNIYFFGGIFFQQAGIRYQSTSGGTYVQTGGTNYGLIGFGSAGSYTLSNGVSSIPELALGPYGTYVQWGGAQSVAGDISTGWTYNGPRSGNAAGSVTLNAGMLTAHRMVLNGVYIQNGGTNSVAEEITISDGYSYGSVYLNGGLLTAKDVTVKPYLGYGGFALVQCGGLHIITNQLTINGAFWSSTSRMLPGVSLCAGAQMIVPNISILNGGALVAADRTVTQAGSLRCGAGLLFPGQGAHQFGVLSVETASGATNANSVLVLPSNTNCVVRFRDSSAVPWANTARLMISNWTGSVFGGGTHQVIFGDSAAALSQQQLTQIVFQNPAPQPAGLYSATILSTGEIVPNALPPTGRVPPTIRVNTEPNHAIRLTVFGESGSDYGIETSTNLGGWVLWTNSIATNGQMSVVDSETTNAARRFYRAILLP